MAVLLIAEPRQPLVWLALSSDTNSATHVAAEAVVEDAAVAA